MARGSRAVWERRVRRWKRSGQSASELAAQEGAGDEAAQLAFVDTFVAQALESPLFYRTMFELQASRFGDETEEGTALDVLA